jgi:hypothetical protein
VRERETVKVLEMGCQKDLQKASEKGTKRVLEMDSQKGLEMAPVKGSWMELDSGK